MSLDLSASAPQQRLRIPGPTTIPERVRNATAESIVGHRSPEMRNVLNEVQSLLSPLFGTSEPVLLFAGSGTSMMEASLANVLGPGEAILVVSHGQFAERFATIARALGADVDTCEVPWGQAPRASDIEPYLGRKKYRAVTVVHNESSTGVVVDLQAIGNLMRDRETLLLVDSVSGVGGLPMQQDEWGLDIVVSASQKALMCPPGLAMASVSQKARAIVEREDRMPRFYFDFRRSLASAEKGETPFTTAVSLVKGLQEALRMVHEESVSRVFERHRVLASALRSGMAALGLEPFGDRGMLSNTVVVASVPESLSGADIVRHMRMHHHTIIAGARNHLADKVIRIGVMGYVSGADILADLHYLENTLRALGWRVPQAGVGVSAAAELLGAAGM